MAIVITESDVRNLINLPTAEAMDMSIHIQVAKLVVDEDLASVSMSDARKTQILLFLAAHFATLALEGDGIVRRVMGDAEEAYRALEGTGLNQTRWGQQAIAFDNTGTLADKASPTKDAQFRVV